MKKSIENPQTALQKTKFIKDDRVCAVLVILMILLFDVLNLPHLVRHVLCEDARMTRWLLFDYDEQKTLPTNVPIMNKFVGFYVRYFYQT